MTIREGAASAAHEQAGTEANHPALKKGLHVLGTLLITLSAVTPASSVFIIVPGVIALAGTGALWSFIIAAVVGVFMAFVYAELSSAYPLTGGEYAIIGRTLGKAPGLIVLWLILMTQILIIAVIALGVGTYLGVLFPALDGPLVAAAAVVAGAVIAVFDIKFNAVVTGTFLAIEMAALVVLASLGFLHVERPITELLLQPVLLADGNLTPATFGAIGIATSIAIFSYNGYGSAVFFGEETHDAHRGIARAILWALAITVAAEMIPLAAILLGAPDLKAMLSSSNMLDYFLVARGGTVVNTVISLAIALAIFNAVVAIILLTARLLFSSGRDRVWWAPINNALTMTHARTHTPWIATLVCGALSAAACFIDLNVLFVVTGTSLVAVYAALCLAVIAERQHCPRGLQDAAVSVAADPGAARPGLCLLAELHGSRHWSAQPRRDHRGHGRRRALLRLSAAAPRRLGVARSGREGRAVATGPHRTPLYGPGRAALPPEMPGPEGGAATLPPNRTGAKALPPSAINAALFSWE